MFVGLSRIISGLSNNGVSGNASGFSFIFVLSPPTQFVVCSLTTDIMPQNCNTAPFILDHSSVLFFFREEKRKKKVASGAEVSSLLNSVASGQEGF